MRIFLTLAHLRFRYLAPIRGTVTLARTGAVDQSLADHGGRASPPCCHSRPLPELRPPGVDPAAVTLTRTGAADQVLANRGASRSQPLPGRGDADAHRRRRPGPGRSRRRRLRRGAAAPGHFPDFGHLASIRGAVTLARTGADDQVVAGHGTGGFAAVLPPPGTCRISASWCRSRRGDADAHRRCRPVPGPSRRPRFAAVLPLPAASRTSATSPGPIRGAVTLARTGADDQAWPITAPSASPRCCRSRALPGLPSGTIRAR